MSIYNLKIQKGLEALKVSNAGAATSGYRRLEARTDGWYDVDDAGVATRLGSGTVGIYGTPVDNQIAIWKTASTIEGDANFTWDGSAHTIVGTMVLSKTSDGSGYLARFTSDKAAGAIIAAQTTNTATTYARGLNNIELGNTNNTTGNYTSIGFIGSAGSEHAAIVSYCTDQTNDYGSLVFMTGDAGGFLQRFKIDPDGSLFANTISAQSSETNVLYYNTSTKEIVYGSLPGGAGLWQQQTGYVELVSATDAVRIKSTKNIEFGGATAYITSPSTGNLDISVATDKTLRILENGSGWLSFDTTATNALLPASDDTVSLGGSSNEFKDLWIDGTANIDSLTLATGATITSFETTLTASSNTLVPTSKAVADYVNSLVVSPGIDWQDSVKDILNPPPGSPAEGDRYIVGTSPTGVWVGKNNQIAEYISSAWVYTVPNEGFAAWVEDEDVVYIFNGTNWVKMIGVYNHNDLANIQGGTTAEYYHLTSAAYSGLTQNTVWTGTGRIVTADGTYLTNSANLTYGSNILTVTSGDIKIATLGNKLLWGDADTYIKEVSDDILGIYYPTDTVKYTFAAGYATFAGAGDSTHEALTLSGAIILGTSSITPTPTNGTIRWTGTDFEGYKSGWVSLTSTATIGGSIASTQVAYGSGTNTIAGSNSFTWISPTLTIGAASGGTGILAVKGNTSGTVSVTVAAAAGTWTMTLPTTAGTDKYALTTNGSGTTTWTQVPYGSGSNTQVAYWGASNAVTGSASFVYASAVLTLGLATGGTGKLELKGNTSGTVGITVAATAGTWTMTLPATGGTTSYALTTSDGAGTLQWSQVALGSGTSGRVAYWTTGNALTSASTFLFSGSTMTLGLATAGTGILALSGTTSGKVNLSVADAAGSWTMKLPANAGTDGYVLKTDGNGNTSWVLNGASAVSVANQADNRIITATGTTDALNAEANLQFDGTTLALTGSQTISANLQLASTSYFYIGAPGAVGTWRWYVSGEELVFERCTAITPTYVEAMRITAT